MIYKSSEQNFNINDLENTFLNDNYDINSSYMLSDEESKIFFINLSNYLQSKDFLNVNILIDDFIERAPEIYCPEFFDLNLHNRIYHVIATSDNPLFLISIYKFLGKLVTNDIKYCELLIKQGFLQMTMNVLNEISSIELQIYILRFIKNLASKSSITMNMVHDIFSCKKLHEFALNYHDLIPDVLKTYYTYLIYNNEDDLVKEIMNLILDFFKFKTKDNMICLIFLLYQFTKNQNLIVDYYLKESKVKNFIHKILKIDNSKSRKAIILYILTSIYDIIPIEDESLFIDVSMLLCDENESILIHTSELMCKFTDNKNSIINEKYIPGILSKLLSISKDNILTVKISSSSLLLNILILYPQYTTMLIKDGLMELVIDMLDMEVKFVTTKAIFYLSSIFEQEKKSGKTNIFDLFLELDGMKMMFSLLDSSDNAIANYSRNFILLFGNE